MDQKRLKKLAINVVKIAISLALLYFVFTKIPFSEVAKVWKRTNILYLIFAAFFFLTSQIVSAKRLQYFLFANQFNLSYRSNLELYFLGMFYNFFIPGGIGGDAYKVYLLNKKFGWSAKQLTSSLFNDRLSGLLAICLLLVGLATYSIDKQWVIFGILLIILGIVTTYFITVKFFKTFKVIFFKTFLLSLLVQILQVLSFILILKSLGLQTNFLAYSALFLASSVLSLVSFAGIGVREMLFLKAARLFHSDTPTAISASLLFTVITAFFSLFGLFFQLRKVNLELTETP